LVLIATIDITLISAILLILSKGWKITVESLNEFSKEELYIITSFSLLIFVTNGVYYFFIIENNISMIQYFKVITSIEIILT
jgi:hypothetical protein